MTERGLGGNQVEDAVEPAGMYFLLYPIAPEAMWQIIVQSKTAHHL